MKCGGHRRAATRGGLGRLTIDDFRLSIGESLEGASRGGRAGLWHPGQQAGSGKAAAGCTQSKVRALWPGGGGREAAPPTKPLWGIGFIWAYPRGSGSCVAATPGSRRKRPCRLKAGRFRSPVPGPRSSVLGPGPLASGLWPLAFGPWPLAPGPWPLVPGPWSLASCLLPLASCLLSLASCLLPLVSCLLPLASCLLSLASCLLPLASCLLSLVSGLWSLVSGLWSLALFSGFPLFGFSLLLRGCA